MVVAQIGVGEDIVADQTSGRITARWSQIVLALDGPTPILTREMPSPRGAIR
jgi:hypothetical protein